MPWWVFALLQKLHGFILNMIFRKNFISILLCHSSRKGSQCRNLIFIILTYKQLQYIRHWEKSVTSWQNWNKYIAEWFIAKLAQIYCWMIHCKTRTNILLNDSLQNWSKYIAKSFMAKLKQPYWHTNSKFIEPNHITLLNITKLCITGPLWGNPPIMWKVFTWHRHEMGINVM